MNKQIILISVTAFMVGFVFNSIFTTIFSPKQMHQMPDGEMMHDKHMDMQAMMHDMNASLRGKTGDALDRAFLDEMIIHHEGAVDMAQVLLDGTQRPELITLANEIISAQNNEINMMKKWKTEWFDAQ